ncbi:helix-turn-helix domain-containing protein [Niveispirillum sp. KHB5.9]|uniref:helix-turn-helix domain-containing protein n=1 Tax=Niveispirillum sp. KHB5.9 TaxID=3400269 RepID=UPI003A8B92AE
MQHHDGVHLRMMRTSRGMSLAALANSAGLSKSEISKLENGVRPFRPDHVIRLAKIFGVGPTEMLSPASPLRSMLSESKAEAELPVYEGRDLARDGLEAKSAGTIARPPQMRGVQGAYAVTVHDLSNMPAIGIGATLLINPNAPANVGDLVVNRLNFAPLALYLRQDDEGVIYGLTLSKKRVELSMDDLDKLHRVVGIWFGH